MGKNKTQGGAAADVTAIVYRRHDGVLWAVAVCIFLGGAGLTALSLILPTDESLTLARVLAAAVGVLLTSLGGVMASFLVTRVGAVRDVEATYTRFLSSSARTLATVYNGLQDATMQRRDGAFEHEETYQAAVLMSSNTILAEYVSITELSGRMRDAFQDSKTDLDAARAVFSTDLITATERAAERASVPLTAPEPVHLSCPNCGSKCEGTLALRAGWTSTVRCAHCHAAFLIHRKSDLTVYVGRVTLPSSSTVAAASPERVLPEGVDPRTAQQQAPAVRAAVSVPCPGCASTIRITLANRKTTTSIRRICIQCASTFTVDAAGVISGYQPGEFRSQPITGRRGSHAVVQCDMDQHPITASHRRTADGAWVALCTTHWRPFEVSRASFRAWLQEHDPSFLRDRLEQEAAGATALISG